MELTAALLYQGIPLNVENETEPCDWELISGCKISRKTNQHSLRAQKNLSKSIRTKDIIFYVKPSN